MHKHKDLIIKWANGAKIQYNVPLHGDDWYDCKSTPNWGCATVQFRVKPKELEPWQLDIVEAIKQGSLVETYVWKDVWTRTHTLEIYVWNDDVESYTWLDRKSYRINWQLDLVNAIKSGKRVEVLIATNEWVKADILERLVKSDDLEHYEWSPKEHYRIKEHLYWWAYETDSGWYTLSKLMDKAEAKKFFFELSVKRFKILQAV